MHRRIALFVVFLECFQVFADDAQRNGAKSPPMEHTLTWTFWDAQKDPLGWDKGMVFWDRKPIGSQTKAVATLKTFDLPPTDKVVIVLPPETGFDRKHWRHWPIYDGSNSGFLRKWLKNGVSVEFRLRGKVLKTHLITWTDYLEGGNFKSDLNTATVVFDGKAIGEVPAALEKLKQQKWEPESLLLVLLPDPWPPPAFGRFDLYGFIIQLYDRKVIVDWLSSKD